MQPNEEQPIGYCEISGEPIYEDMARVELDGKLYLPELFDKNDFQTTQSKTIMGSIMDFFRG
jgi:hypothetical protein